MTECSWQSDGYEHWMASVEGGSIRLSRCEHSRLVFGHDWSCASDDAYAATRLFLAARRKAREWGCEGIVVHSEQPGDADQFWERQGARELYRAYEVRLRAPSGHDE